MKMDNGPLSDVRVIELGHVIAAPMCGALLSDFGADVVKIERPGMGDMLRVLSARTSDGVGAWWKTLARNKRLMALDWTPMCLSRTFDPVFWNGQGWPQRSCMSGTPIW